MERFNSQFKLTAAGITTNTQFLEERPKAENSAKNHYLNATAKENLSLGSTNLGETKMSNLEIIIKITKDKGVILGHTVLLNGKPRCVSATWNGALILTCLEPKTLFDAEALVYLPSELAEFAEKGQLEGMVNIED